MKLKSYKELKVWQKSLDLAVDVYKVTKDFPKAELYGLTSQIRRAAFSIPANIAEGYTRGSLKEYIQFLRIGFSSGAELETHLLIAKKTRLLNRSNFKNLNNQLNEVMRMLNVLIAKLINSKTKT